MLILVQYHKTRKTSKSIFVQKKNATSKSHFSARQVFFFLSSWDWGLPTLLSGKNQWTCTLAIKLYLPRVGKKKSKAQKERKYKSIHHPMRSIICLSVLSWDYLKCRSWISSGCFRLKALNLTVFDIQINYGIVKSSMSNQGPSILMLQSLMYLCEWFWTLVTIKQNRTRGTCCHYKTQNRYTIENKCTKITAEYLR